MNQWRALNHGTSSMRAERASQCRADVRLRPLQPHRRRRRRQIRRCREDVSPRAISHSLIRPRVSNTGLRQSAGVAEPWCLAPVRIGRETRPDPTGGVRERVGMGDRAGDKVAVIGLPPIPITLRSKLEHAARASQLHSLIRDAWQW